MSSYVWQLLGYPPPRAPPTLVPTDEVVPLHPFDDTKTLSEYTLVWTFRFDEVLDADKLGQSLSQLFQMEGWRKLGGRLRKAPNGKTEVHIPTPFTEARPSILFSKESHQMRMCDHPEASKLPEASNEPKTFPSPRNYISLALGPDAPRTFEDFIHSDHPQFSLHVVTFEDGTLVSVNFNHMTTDLGGFAAVIDAWKLVLAGRPEAVPKFEGFRDDPMAPLYTGEPTEKIRHGLPHLNGFGLISWAMRQMLEFRFYPAESRTLCIPAKIADALLKEAKDQAASEGTDSQGKPMFASEHDVIIALINRFIAEGFPSGSQRNIVTLMAVDPRPRAKSVFRDDAAYVQNAALGAFVQCSAPEALTLPTGKLALRSREALSTQSSEGQFNALLWMAHDHIKKTGNTPLFGDSSMAFVVVSNWSKAALMDRMDFSPAVVKQAKNERSARKPGHPVYFQSQSIDEGSFSTSIVVIMGRDRDRNLWLFGDFQSHVWSKFTDYLRTYL
ncbi:unnamed protein product [Clonostachys byssicola]|uniref:Uncharacterized protein n=1 Tax=Clonostachys byssicola TaxID=160290 RepID=A0A9N9XWB3_9HYPO|nr:unnamed protein product [Clonostachys byssicola]